MAVERVLGKDMFIFWMNGGALTVILSTVIGPLKMVTGTLGKEFSVLQGCLEMITHTSEKLKVSTLKLRGFGGTFQCDVVIMVTSGGHRCVREAEHAA